MSVKRISLPGNYRGYSEPVADGYRKDACYVAVRDGCRLAIDVYRPTSRGEAFDAPFPTVVISTGYRRSFVLKDGEFMAAAYAEYHAGDCVSAVTRAARLVDRHRSQWHEPVDALDTPAFRDLVRERGSVGEYLLVHGYNIVIIDNRATGASFGGSDGLDHQTQGQDAGDIFDWIVAQPWSTDAIGMIGSSWLGLAQNATMSCLPKHLKAVLPVNAGMDTFVPMYPGGLYNVGLMRQWYGQRNMFERGFEADVVDEDPAGTLRAQAVAERRELSEDPPWILTIPPLDEREALLDRYAGWSRERYQQNSRYYDRLLPDGSQGDWQLGHLDPTLANRSGVAYYGYGGFWDLCGYTMAMAFANLTVPQKLLVGPWHHGNWKQSEHDEHLRWLDHHLKGIDNGIMAEPPVTYATSHPSEAPRWHATDSFPPGGIQSLRLHGTPGPGLRGGLSRWPAGTGTIALHVDYDVTTGLANRNWGHNTTDYLHLDELEPYRDTVVTLLSEPVEEETEITGFPVLSLTVSIDAEAGAVFAYLQDVAPDGDAHYLSEGQLNLRDRRVSEPPFDYLGLPYHSVGEADRLPVVPGEPMELAIALHSVSWRVPPGHRLALTITGADQANAYQRPRDPAPTLTIYLGGERPLTLDLPTMPEERRPPEIAGAYPHIRDSAKRAQRPTATRLTA